MKATAQPLLTSATLAEKSWLSVYADLFKARLTSLALVSMLVGFYLGCRGPLNYALLLHALLGTALVGCGAAALNQFIERKYDALMRRTQDRPLPTGRLQPATVLAIGLGASVAGVLYLALLLNVLAALLGALTLVSYLFLYTPLKRRTWLNTAVGAVPGGLPPLIGWAAARGQLGLEALSLFAIQALWQVPHFMAIAWIYRDEYARAGFKMLPVLDPQGRRTSRQALGHALLLLPMSLAPFVFRLTGALYLSGAFVLGLAFIWCAISFARQLTVRRAKQLFFLSIVYLPLLMGLMVLDKRSEIRNPKSDPSSVPVPPRLSSIPTLESTVCQESGWCQVRRGERNPKSELRILLLAKRSLSDFGFRPSFGLRISAFGFPSPLPATGSCI